MRVITMWILAALTGQASAQADAPPPSIQALAACRTLTDPAARLACYDRAAGELEQAVAAKSVVVLDKAEVAQTRRSLFGLRLPKLKIFGGGEDGDDGGELKELTAKVTEVRPLGYGKWRLMLDDGAPWETTEPLGTFARDPVVGDTVNIRRGMAGYFLKIGRQNAVRARRIN
jgi:hypothetical protein